MAGESDQQIDLFEYTLSKVLDRHLFEPSGKQRDRYYSLIPLLPKCATIVWLHMCMNMHY